MKVCNYCKKPLLKRYQRKFCSNRCQSDYQYQKYIESWGKGLEDGNRGINTRNISGYLKRYLVEKFGNKCSFCGWHKQHPVTGNIPLEIDHIDGNSENNSESNLRLLCPNCHALTPSFKNLNKGKGRIWRKNKYTKINLGS